MTKDVPSKISTFLFVLLLIVARPTFIVCSVGQTRTRDMQIEKVRGRQSSVLGLKRFF